VRLSGAQQHVFLARFGALFHFHLHNRRRIPQIRRTAFSRHVVCQKTLILLTFLPIRGNFPTIYPTTST
jgi:hypothetical protein